jgi:hypothetical protein
MAKMLFEKPLDAVDVGDEAPLYEPRPWVKPPRPSPSPDGVRKGEK